MNKTAVFAAPLALLAFSAMPLLADDPITEVKRAEVTITEPVQVPGGAVLAPGAYTFVLDRVPGNRNIVEIRGENGEHLDAIAFTTRTTRAGRSGHSALMFYEMPAGQTPAIRQWFAPGDSDGQEFLYPHSEAARLGQMSNQTIPEVNDQEYANVVDQGFSTRYPADTSATSGQTPTPGQSSASGSNQAPEPLNQPGTRIVGDPGATGRGSQDLQPSR